MATHTTLSSFIFTLLFLTTTISAATATSAATAAASSATFIQSKCSSTAYPTVCVQSLSSYADKIQQSPRQLAQTALIVSLSKARYAKSYVAQLGKTTGLSPREAGALKDCLEEIGDTIDRLGKAVHEFQVANRGVRSRDFQWHMSNVVTWASAALTDENTCVDGFSGRALNGRLKSGIKAQFGGVLQCTSNALALVNQFANKYV